MEKRASLALLSGLLAVALAGPAEADRRVALVIGNSTYEFASRLPNPENDARDMAALLEGIGFDVTLALDQNFQSMRIALRDFADKAAGADISTVFYAGHGIEIDKQNFLIPVDARLGRDRNVRFEAIALDDVLLAGESASGLTIVILDACRENPFASAMKRAGATRSIGRGLARVEPEGSSVLVAYAAREGQVATDGDGRNSPYTKALLDTLATPGIEVGLLFRRVRESVIAATGSAQQPFVYQSLGADPIYLVPPVPAEAPRTQPDGASAAASGADQAPRSGLDEPAQVWAATRDTESIAVIEAFIARYDGTVYADLARARLEELEAVRSGRPDNAAPHTPPPPPTQGSQTPQTAALALPKGIYRSTYGTIDFRCGGNGWCTGGYRGSGDKRPATIAGQLSGDGQLVGHWIETSSNKKCAETVQGSHYWGRVVFRFSPERESWNGTWSYCGANPNQSWDGRR